MLEGDSPGTNKVAACLIQNNCVAVDVGIYIYRVSVPWHSVSLE